MKQRLGNRIKDLRLARGLSQKELAHRVGVVQSYISHLEHGEREMPSRHIVIALANALGTSEEDLLTAAGYIPQKTAEGALIDLANPELAIILAKIGDLPQSDQEVILDILRPIIARNERARKEREKREREGKD